MFNISYSSHRFLWGAQGWELYSKSKEGWRQVGLPAVWGRARLCLENPWPSGSIGPWYQRRQWALYILFGIKQDQGLSSVEGGLLRVLKPCMAASDLIKIQMLPGNKRRILALVKVPLCFSSHCFLLWGILMGHTSCPLSPFSTIWLEQDIKLFG